MIEQHILQSIGKALEKATPTVVTIKWQSTEPLPIIDYSKPFKIKFVDELDIWSR